METTLQLSVGLLLNQNLALNKLCTSMSTLFIQRNVKRKEAPEMSIKTVRNINQTVVGYFAYVPACDPQRWLVFVPKPEAD